MSSHLREKTPTSYMLALYACCVMRIVLSMLNITYYEIGSVIFSYSRNEETKAQ